MSQIYHTEAYLIKQIDLPQYDRLGVFYTKQYGKQTLILKGIKKPSSKLQYRLYDWGKSEIEFVIGKHSSRLIAIEDINSYQYLYGKVETVGLLGIVFELVDQLIDDNHPDLAVFECINQYIQIVSCEPKYPHTLVSWLIIRLLYLLGYGINLSHCVLSGATRASEFGISVRSGGLVSKLYQSHINDYIPLSIREIQVLRQWQQGIWVEVEPIPWKLIQYHLQWHQLQSNSLHFIFKL